MNTKKVYIAGKVTGEEYENCVNKFKKRAEILRNQGYSVVNPMEIIPPNTDWRTAMKICVNELIDCEYIYMLPGWRDSKGAKLEYQLAQELDLQNLNGKL